MTVNRERKILLVYTGANINLEYNTLKQASEQIQRLIAQYGEGATIKKRSEQYSDSEYLAVYVDRLETDVEMARRITKEERYEANQAERDRVEFERLKSLFGGA